MSHRASGLRAWIWQRVSAAVLALGTLGALGYWLAGGAPDYAGWRAALANPPVTVAVAVWFGALLAHAWVGVRDVILDYVAIPLPRYLALAALAVGLLALGVWMLLILARVF